MARCGRGWALLVALLLAPLACDAGQWQVRVDDSSGLPQISRGGGPAMTSALQFWAENWRWAGFTSAFSVQAPGRYRLQGQNPTLGFALQASIEKTSEQTLTWRFDLDAQARQPDVQGGGMVFNFDPALTAEMGEPQLLPGNHGWAWGKAGQRRVELRFEPALAKVYFERGNPDEVRAFFYSGEVAPGQQHYQAVLSVSGDLQLAPTRNERFGLDDPAGWPLADPDWRSTPVDLSFLNQAEKPAGKRGFVRAVGEQLQFADGSVARFWGTNLSAYALFATPDEEIATQARRLSALGFNLVRLHHHDSPWVSPNIFGDPGTLRDTQQLDSQAQRKIDVWIKQLKDQGIYVWLDLHVERALLAGDRIDGFAEAASADQGMSLKGYAYVNRSVQQAMQRFAGQYLSHVNPYTGLAYKDDPAVAAILLTNENDITQHFGNALLPDKHVPLHSRLYMDLAQTFAEQHGLPVEQTWRAWEHGPAKLFLNDLQQRVAAEQIRYLRALGVKVPIVTTSTWGGNPLSSLPALTAGDMLDVHGYAGAGQLERNPLCSDNLVNWLGAAQVVGRPMSVSEWNAEPFPTPDRHALPLYVAASAAHQGWSALLQYAYSQEAFSGWSTASNWHAYNDPGLLATLPAAALLYRRGDVRAATTQYVFAPSAQRLFDTEISPRNAVALRTAMEKGRLQIAMPATTQLPWLTASSIAANSTLLQDPGQSLLDADAGASSSDSGQLRRDWQAGLYTIDTPLTQAATGWLGGRTVTLRGIEVKLSTPFASVAVQSLDNQALARSHSLLISLGSRAVPQAQDQLPFHLEPLAGTLRIKAREGLRLYRHDASGRLQHVAATFTNGHYLITFDGKTASNWLFLK